MITYKGLAEPDLSKSAEIDRSEAIRIGYEVREGALVEMEGMWDTPNFIAEGEGEHTLPERSSSVEVTWQEMRLQSGDLTESR